MSSEHEQVAKKFLPDYIVQSIEPLGNGLINQTFLVTAKRNDELKKIVLQKINSSVYSSPELLVQNHLALFNELRNKDGSEYKIISELLSTKEGNYSLQVNGEYWRAQAYTKNIHSHDEVVTEEIAFEGAKIVGRFNTKCSAIDHIKLQDPIKGFHNLSHYLSLFTKNIDSKTNNRLGNFTTEIKYINALREEMLELFKMSEKLPLRVCHYDTKINNILFDKVTNKAIQIVDLDNMMFGKVIFDFGDMMRTFISPVDENEKELNKVKIRWEIVEAIVKGYLSETQNMLTKEEKSMLVSGGILITYEQAIRFLTDYLIGDRYYKTEYPNHNLIRTKNQIHLVQLFIKHKQELEHFVLNS